MHDHSPGKIHQGHAFCVVCVSAVLSAFARAVWPGAMVLCSVVFALLLFCCFKFQVSKWVSGCVVLEAV